MRDMAILRFINAFQRAYEYSPSIREIQNGLRRQFPGMSTSTIDYNLRKLRENLLLRWPTFEGRYDGLRVPHVLIITDAGHAALEAGKAAPEGARTDEP